MISSRSTIIQIQYSELNTVAAQIIRSRRQQHNKQIQQKDFIMGLLDNIFNDDKKKKKSNNNNNNNNNPLANIRKNIEKIGKPKMTGPGYSLGGSKPGQVFEIILPNPGPLGIRVEQKTSNSASAIVNMVVQGSQAEAAGLKRGDVLCFAGSNGQNEIPYSMFLEIAKSREATS